MAGQAKENLKQIRVLNDGRPKHHEYTMTGAEEIGEQICFVYYFCNVFVIIVEICTTLYVGVQH